MAIPRTPVRATALLLLAACGGSTEPGDSSPAGLWNFSFSGTTTSFGGTYTYTCHTEFVGKITDTGSAVSWPFEIEVPVTATTYCDDQPIAGLGGEVMMILQNGDQLTFQTAGPTTFMVATYGGSAMGGTVTDKNWEFVGTSFRATRYPGATDPNDAPAEVRIESAVQVLALGDSLLIEGSARTGYYRTIPDPDIAWSSSDHAVATIEARGGDGTYAYALVRGLGPGSVTIVGGLGDAADSLVLTVAQP